MVFRQGNKLIELRVACRHTHLNSQSGSFIFTCYADENEARNEKKTTKTAPDNEYILNEIQISIYRQIFNLIG